MKKILLTIICFFCIFCINNAVSASEATCVYVNPINEDEYYTIAIKDDKLNIDYSLKENGLGNKIVVKSDALHIGNFIENNQYVCRNTLYYYSKEVLDPNTLENSVEFFITTNSQMTEIVLDKTRSNVVNDGFIVNPDVPDDEVIIPDDSPEDENTNSGNNTNNFFGNLPVVKCGDTEIPAPIPPITRIIVLFIKIAAPLVLIIMGMIDIVKAVTASDEKKMKEAQTKFVKRLIPAALIFLIVTIFQLLVGIIADSTTESDSLTRCIDCMISDETKCN